MPSLGKFDKLSATLATADDINARRAQEESLLLLDGALLQFDTLSRQRMKDVIAGLTEARTVIWRLADNTEQEFTALALRDLFERAEQAIGARVITVFEIAQKLKAKVAAGERVTLRDLDQMANLTN